MKIIRLLVYLLISLFLFRSEVTAQRPGLFIVAVDYQTRDDIDFLFENSSQVLEYLEGIDIDRPTFLSIVTDQQKNTIKSKGYNLKILEENADVNRFVLLYNPQPDQSEKLRPFGDPIVISAHYTLLKMPIGKEFTHEGESGRFFDIPFSTIISPPPLRTKTATEVVIVSEQNQFNNNNLPVILLIIFFVLVLGIGIYIYIKKRREKNTY